MKCGDRWSHYSPRKSLPPVKAKILWTSERQWKAYYMCSVPTVDGDRFPLVSERQAQYTAASRSGGRLVFSSVCGEQVFLTTTS